MTQWAKPADMARVYEAVEANPGQRPAAIGKIALSGFGRDNIYRILPRMERHGFLLYEDERGKLYPFKVVERG